jgi:hypothetical protein
MNFWDRLYKGLGAEYFITGELFMAGYEAFKLPADFGLDLIVTSQKQQSFSALSQDKMIPPPYVFQVKSRKIEQFDKNNQGRLEASTEFCLKEDDWQLLINDNSSYLICVLTFTDDVHKLQNRIIYFWLHSSHLCLLQERGYIYERKDPKNQRLQYLLKVVLRLQATLDLEKVLDDLISKDYLTQEGKDILFNKIAKSVSPSWKSSEYISLKRSDESKDSGEAIKKIPFELTSFSKLGENIDLLDLLSV